MKIAVCGSIEFTHEMKEVADELAKKGHRVLIPKYSQKILNGDLTLKEFKKEKQENGDLAFRHKSKKDLIKRYYRLIGKADAILVVNLDKKGVKNYIGGNTFLEMGFAHVLEKRIFLLNDIPKMDYSDELKAMNPVVIKGDLSKIG